MWTCEFKVRGAGRFPIDMLRYDGCYPMDQMSVNNISERGDPREEREVRLIMISSHKSTCNPTPERWSSFGWRVLRPVRILKGA